MARAQPADTPRKNLARSPLIAAAVLAELLRVPAVLGAMTTLYYGIAF
jgi:hypothetical protein